MSLAGIAYNVYNIRVIIKQYLTFYSRTLNGYTCCRVCLGEVLPIPQLTILHRISSNNMLDGLDHNISSYVMGMLILTLL